MFFKLVMSCGTFLGITHLMMMPLGS
ncbi:hypothetical protein OIU84_006657 [Salix udensis]|uniref:Uncharacterized protein n=1 Tax=Salix udensis TaxID=889485 RepID=A0AAD6K0U2_9ROSI|nr:hypothetical protein OIU84_006657 [Salix udensis]